MSERYPSPARCNPTAFVPIECRGPVVRVVGEQGRNVHVEEDAVGDEGIVLTDRERETLAGLAEQIGDPWLARQLAGGEPPPPPKKPLAGLAEALLRATPGWAGLLILVAGAVLTVTMFVRSTVVASLGLAMMGFGAWRIAVDRADDLILRLKAACSRRARPAGPPPPHKQPGAA
jgi:hypothetical protein